MQEPESAVNIRKENSQNADLSPFLPKKKPLRKKSPIKQQVTRPQDNVRKDNVFASLLEYQYLPKKEKVAFTPERHKITAKSTTASFVIRGSPYDKN